MRVSNEIVTAVKKKFVIYSSYVSKNKYGRKIITIKFANKLSANTVSTEKTASFEDLGGVYKTLGNEIGLNIALN